VANEVVPSKDARALVVGHDLRERRLLNGQERPDLVAARTEHADDRRHDQQHDIATERKDDAGQQHQSCTQQQHAFPSDAIRRGGDPQRDACVADQRESEQRTDLRRGQAHLRQVQRQYDGQEAVCEQPHEAGGKQ